MDFQAFMDVRAIVSQPMFACAMLFGVIAAFGIFRDGAHHRRRDLDAVSLVPWGTVSSVALIVAIVCLGAALRRSG